MPTLEELLNSRDQSLSSFSSPNEEESVVDESSLTPEEMTAAAALGISTKRLSKKAYGELKNKAEQIVKQSSVPSKTAREAAKGIVKGGGTKSAEVSARAFQEALEKGPIKVPSGPVISDLPQVSGKMGAAMDKAARAAAGTTSQDVIALGGEGAAGLASKNPFLSRLATMASSPGAKTALKGMGLAGLISSLYGEDLSEDQDKTESRQLTAAEMMNTLPGKPVNYQPSGDRSEMNPIMASSMYDSPQQIVADLARAKEEPARQLAAPEAPSEVLKPAPRTVSAGEPSVGQVQKQEQDAALAQVLKSQDAEQSRYAELLNRFKDAQERQRMAQLGVGLTQAAERIGSSIAMVKPGDQTPYEQAMKLAGGITEEFKEEAAVAREAEKNDPKSAESQSMRALLKEQGIAVPDNISAAFIEKQYPQFSNILSRREAAKERAELRRERAEERAERKFDRLDQEKRAIALRIAPKIQNKQYETLAELQSQKSLIDEAVNNPNPQRDTTMFYSFVKALDPNSVVREGEIKFSQAARSIPTSVRGIFNKAFKGQMLLPEERKNIQEFMNQRLDLAKKSWEASAAPYLKQAEESKIDRELIAPGISALESAPAKSEKKTIKLAQKLSGKAGKTFTDNKTGKKYVVNPDETSATEL